jgi:hypothetical protein
VDSWKAFTFMKSTFNTSTGICLWNNDFQSKKKTHETSMNSDVDSNVQISAPDTNESFICVELL